MRLLTVVSVLVFPVAAWGLEPDLWTLSASPTDPFVNAGAPAGGERTLYLWFDAPEDSVRLADIGIIAQGGMAFSPPTPEPGIQIRQGIWGHGHYLIEWGPNQDSCTGGLQVVASMSVTDTGGLLCFETFSFPCSHVCGAGFETVLADHIGFSSTGARCVRQTGTRERCGPYAPVVPDTWGRTKALYRR